MNDIQKDWIIFLGVVPDLHDEAVVVVREWREYARANGVDRDGLTGLNGRLFGGKRLTAHSCCLSYGSLRIDGYDTVVADFIDGGRLPVLPELFENAGRGMPEGDWKYMLVNQPVTFLWYTEYFYVLGFTLDGRIVIDTKEMYGVRTDSPNTGGPSATVNTAAGCSRPSRRTTRGYCCRRFRRAS